METEPIGQFTVVERANLRMGESVMSNYKNSQEALLDLIDNAVDNRIEGKKIIIKVNLTRDNISIYNQGGEGLDLEGLENFLNWGHSDKNQRQIGQYGVGGKSAIGFLGQSMEVRWSPKDSNREYHLEDKNWGSKPEASEQKHTGDTRRTNIKDGYFRVVVSNIPRLQKRAEANAVIAKLAETYKPLLVSGEAEITVNGKLVEPAVIKYLDDPDFKPIEGYVETGEEGLYIRLMAGILAERDISIAPGFWLFYRGRLIKKGDFLGHPTVSQMPQVSRFYAEAHLNHVHVTTNKSDFIEDDPMFLDAVSVLREVTRPLIDKLHDLKIEQFNQVEKFEVQLTRQAKSNFEHVLNHNPELLNRTQLAGESRGRLPASPRGQSGAGTSSGSRSLVQPEGATPPDLRATAGPNVKRWGPFIDWEPVAMGTDEIACEIVKTGEGGERPSLKINIDYPMYQAQKLAGDQALEIYVLDIAVSEIGRSLFNDQPLETYMEWVQKARKHVGTFYAFKLANQISRQAKRSK